jgi:DNA-binding transcriptional MerR regulator
MLLDLPAFCRVGDVARLLGEKQHVIRWWEHEFRRWVQPTRSRRGQRIYSRHTVEILLEIRRLLRVELYTIAGARRQLARRVHGEGT